MSIRSRLTECFSAVFPSLSDGQIQNASTDNLDLWDSLATVRLFAVIEEEFGFEIDLDDVEQLNSFARIEQLLETRVG